MTINDFVKSHTDSEGKLDTVAGITVIFVITSILQKFFNEIYFNTDIKELEK